MTPSLCSWISSSLLFPKPNDTWKYWLIGLMSYPKTRKNALEITNSSCVCWYWRSTRTSYTDFANPCSNACLQLRSMSEINGSCEPRTYSNKDLISLKSLSMCCSRRSLGTGFEQNILFCSVYGWCLHRKDPHVFFSMKPSSAHLESIS